MSTGVIGGGRIIGCTDSFWALWGSHINDKLEMPTRLPSCLIDAA